MRGRIHGKIFGLILLLLGLTAAPLLGAASAAQSVQAEQVGRQVRVTGEAPPNSEVALVVLGGGEVPVHADQTTAGADGAFRFVWTPGGWEAGTYEVRVTGDGLASAMTAHLTYVPAEGPGDDPGEDPGDGPGNGPGDEPGDDPGSGPGDDPGSEPGDDPGSSPGGDSGGSRDPSEDSAGSQDPSEDSAGTGTAEAEPTERGVRIRLGGSGERLPDGLLTSAMQTLSSLGEEAGRNGEIVIELSGGEDGEGWVELPADELLAAVTEDLARRTTLIVRLGEVEYALPLDVLLEAAGTWKETENRQGGSSGAGGFRLRIDIRKAEEGTVPGTAGMQLLSDAYRFEIRAAGLSSDAEWKRFTGRYAVRILPLKQLPGSGYAGGFYWEEGMAEPAFAPLRVERREGAHYAVLTRAGNSVYFVAESEPPALRDIAGHWAEPTLRRLAAQRLVFGMPDGAFRPDEPVTRAQFSALLARAAALTQEPADAAGTGFADVRSGDWHEGAVRAVASQGWMAGYGDGRFGPDGMLTRQEAAVALHRIWTQAAGAKQESAGEPGFADRTSIAPWAADAVAALADLGILQGTPDGRFRPERTLTRAEAAEVLSRLLEALGWTGGQA